MRRRAADERGQSLVIVTLAMVAVLGMAAVAIDVATWYQKHHQAQVAADAAALAGANCMATGSCTSTTAVGVAQTMGSTNDNGYSIPATDVTVNTSASTVTVTVPNPAPSFFAKLFNVASTPTAQATAKWNGGSSGITNCPTTPNSSCYAVFGYDSACNGPPATAGENSLGVTNNGNTNSWTGATHSNGNIINTGNNSTTFSGTNTYGSVCNSAQSKITSPSLTTAQGTGVIDYPLDFSGQAPNPANDGSYTCTYVALGSYFGQGTTTATASNLPSGMTLLTSAMGYSSSTGKLTLSSSDPAGVYCDYGPAASGNTRQIVIGTSTPSGGASFVSNSFTLDANNGTLSPYVSNTANPDNMLLYEYAGSSTGSDNWNGTACAATSPELKVATGQVSIVGGIFSPCGQIYATSNKSSFTGFIEGYDVNLAGNSVTGTGPESSSTGTTVTTSTGTDTLTQ